ncbi:MAG TPA: hypothetical protein VE263_09090 [Candidatus Angelobacter sp.]|nr:hypothetical protein [Candidatus Angelobacter sp.]
MTHKSKIAAFILCLAFAAAAAADQRVNLLPKLQPGQVLHYLIHFRSDKKVKTESNVVVPLGPNAAQVDAHGLLRIEILDVQQAAGKPVVHGRAQFLAADPSMPTKNPEGKSPLSDTQPVLAVGKAVEFTISSSGFFEQVSGLDALSPENQQAWQEWAARFAAAWILPAQGARIGEKWKSQELEPGASPIAALSWQRDSSYVRNEPCRTSQLSVTGEFSPSSGSYDSCAVLLTSARLTQRSSSKDSTPEEFKIHELRTMGTAKGSNEMITYISLTTGLVVRATEEASQQMDVVVAKADGSNRVHYNVDATSHVEVLLVTGVSAASP